MEHGHFVFWKAWHDAQRWSFKEQKKALVTIWFNTIIARLIAITELYTGTVLYHPAKDEAGVCNTSEGPSYHL